MNQLIPNIKPFFQYLKPDHWLQIYSYDNATSITEEMKIINHIDMIFIFIWAPTQKRLQPLFYKILLVESTNPHVFLAPTKITFSSYNWVKASTSTHIGFNLYREDNMFFFLEPPYYPCFLDLKHVQYNI